MFAGLFPTDQSEFVALRSAINKLTLNDASVTIFPDSRCSVNVYVEFKMRMKDLLMIFSLGFNIW